MIHNSGNEAVCRLGKAVFIVFVIEGVFAVFEKGDVCVHSRAALAENGLRHECCIKSVAVGKVFNNKSERHNIVRRAQDLVIFKVNFMLAFCVLVVGRFNFKAHAFKRQADVLAAVLALVNRAEVKIAAPVMAVGGGTSLFIRAEKEEFALRANIAGVAHVGGLFDCALENMARIALKRGAVGEIYITDEPCGFSALALPGENNERVEVGVQAHIRLLNADKAVNRRAVKAAAVVKRFFKLASCY